MRFYSIKTKVFLTLLSMLAASFLTASVFGQAGTSSVSGTVSDAQGAVIAGATVTLKNVEKGFSRSVVTSDSGVYTFPTIPPDTYTVEVEGSGFKKHVSTNVVAAIDTPATLNVTMEVGAITDVVTVTANTIDSIVNTQDASIGNNFQPQQIQQLPTNSRNIAGLLSLQPGVTREGYVNGGRSDQANITLDGVDINDQQQNPAFSPVLRIKAESVEEFRVTTSNPNANQGRSSGAQISLLTKSGSNDLRGAAFWLHRPTEGSANEFFNNREGLPRPNIKRNVFGGAIGGPIMKDRLFFFYAYEGIRENIGTSVVSTVPLASLGAGIVNIEGADGVVRQITPANWGTYYTVAAQNPAALAVLAAAAARYPANDFASGAGDNLNTAGFRFAAPRTYNENTHTAKFDWNINSSQSMFLRLNKQHDVRLGAPAFPDTPAPQTWSHNTGLAVGHNWTIGNNKVNNFRYGLSRQAFTVGGDAAENAISFRFVYSPLNFTYGLSRVTPVHNFTDDFTWTFGDHTLQFGGNVRVIRNKREDNGAGYDQAVINPSYYSGSGSSLIPTSVRNAYQIGGNNLPVQAAVAAIIGRYSQYTANYNYDLNGDVLPAGTVIRRNFATEEYDAYIQDSWKPFQNLTLNFGVRYALSRPVYEKDGYMIRPDIPLGDYFALRASQAAAGVPHNGLIQFELAGPKYGKDGFYSTDYNNFQPRFSAAWSPDFSSGFLNTLFGDAGDSVIRGGFAMTNDYFGQQLAVTFNGLSTLGFLTSDTIAPNTYSITAGRLGPLFTGFGQQINNMPGMAPLENRFFTPADEDTRIESSLDSTLVSPVNYNWSLTYGRKLPKGMYFEASYVGRKARNLLVTRDVMMPNNLVDPRSGQDWYTAAGRIYDYYYAGADPSAVAPVAYFENLFPQLANYFAPNTTATQNVFILNRDYAFGDWTYLQLFLDDGGNFGPTTDFPWANLYYQPQYAAFSSFSTTGKSDYHGGNLSFRQRLGETFTWDFNYTYSKSMDDASGLQTSTTYGSAFVLNALRPEDNYSVSDFDTRHVVNANAMFQLPFGRGRAFFSDMHPVADALLGGWQLAGIFRWNSGLPFGTPTDLAGWPTNWNLRSATVRTQAIQTSINRGGDGQAANIFTDLDALLNSLRPARPGETGDRNVFRGSSYSTLDMNLGKTFKMPWSENHNLQLRWEVFNVLNKQYLDEGSIATFSYIPDDPFTPGNQAALNPGTGEFSDIKRDLSGFGSRMMQFLIRYSF